MLGAGHVARCLPLAQALARRGCAPDFVGAYDGLAAWMLERSGLAMVPPQHGVCCGLDTGRYDAAVVDSYAIPEDELCELAVDLPVATMGEARRCPDRGVWIDYHVDRAGEAPTDRLLPGPAFAPLDLGLAGVARPGRDVRRALVTLGGSAAVRTLAVDIAHALRSAFPGVRLIVASGAEVEGDDVETLPFPTRLDEAFATVDLAVSAAGFTAYELACAGVPMLIIPLAPNQRRVARGCESSGIAQVAEARPRAIEAALRELRDPDRRAHLAAAGRAMVDGRGAERAAAALLERWFPAGERMPTGG